VSLGVLARLFREEANKTHTHTHTHTHTQSMDLVINIVYILFAFSNFSSFHESMTEYKMGDMVVKVNISVYTHTNTHTIRWATWSSRSIYLCTPPPHTPHTQ
jgi:hypothetical protein